MASRQLVEKGEIRSWLDPERGNRHEPGERQRRCANGSGEHADFADRAAALLLLLTDVHLNVDRGEAPRLVRFLDEGIEKRRAIERMDRVEQLDGFGGL